MEQKILSKKQLKVLEAVSGDKEIAENFYLSGGTALAGYYIPYRLSEDLDFFSEHEFDPGVILTFLKKNKEAIDYKDFDYQRSFNRNLIFLKFNEEELKLEFTYYPFPQVEEPKIEDGLKIDSLLDIAVNKVFTISQNPRTRDFLDLYFILQNKKWDFFELLKKARMKFDWHIDPINLGTQLMKSQDVKDYPKLFEKIDDKKWQDFFLGIAKELGEKL